jgi:glycosyltransferase involved in cell wall biosynthesis
MKIIIASLLPPGNSSGTEKFIKILYTELKTKNIDVFLSNRNFNLGIVNYLLRLSSRIVYKCCPNNIWLGWDLVYSTISVGINIVLVKFRKRTITIIHAQDIFAACIALWISRYFKCFLILNVHFNESVAEEFIENRLLKRDGLLHKTVDCIERCVLQKADHVVFVSEFMRQNLLNKYRIKSHSLIYNGSEKVSRHNDDIDEPRGKNILLNIGTLEKRKNQIYLIEMFACLLKKNNNYELWLIGEGVDYENLKTVASAKGISSSVRFFGKTDNVYGYLLKTFLYLHAALKENFSFVLLEAQSFGIPIIAPPVGGIPELVKEGYNGYLLKTDEENICNWISTIENIATHERLYLDLSKNSKVLFDRNFTKEIMIDRYIDLYKNI